jgi:multimeric flavodoxin WrbA
MEGSMAILGFSSSAIKDGNVDRMVRAVLEKSGKPFEFIRMADLSYGPCRACAHLCAGDNMCKLEDDLKPFYHKIVSADAIILGTPVYFNSMNGFMALFLERMWSFRHQRFPLTGKPFGVVSTGDRLDGAEMAVDAVKRRMAAYKARFVGGVSYGSTIFPCYTCGYGTTCRVGGFYHAHGEEGLKTLEIAPKLFKSWEDHPGVAPRIDELAWEVASIVK